MILGIVQARMGSTRLPGKPKKKIAGIPLLDLVLRRVSRAMFLDRIVVSTTGNKEDFAIQRGKDLFAPEVEFYREKLPRDPLGGFYDCANHFGADIVVRITADDPLKDPELIDECISCMLEMPIEYCSNTLTPTFPWGLDIEAIRMKTLRWLNDNVHEETFREHVTYYIREHPEQFATHNFEYVEDLHEWNWSIDTPEDLERMNRLFKEGGFDPVKVGYKEVIRYAKAHRERAKVYTGSLAS